MSRCPRRLTDLAKNLMKAGRIADSDCWIVPGVSFDGAAQPEVMRGEECQMLGALLQRASVATAAIPDAGHAFKVGARRPTAADSSSAPTSPARCSTCCANPERWRN